MILHLPMALVDEPMKRLSIRKCKNDIETFLSGDAKIIGLEKWGEMSKIKQKIVLNGFVVCY